MMRFSRLFYPVIAFFAVCSALGNVAPEALSPAPTPMLRSGGAVQEIDLRSVFRDPDVTGSVVRVNVRIGSTVKPVHLALFDQEKPITVANFLAYVNSGRHNNNFFHRSVPGFVVQGGGFKWNAAGDLDFVPTYASIQNEPGISNVRGTIAMAKLGGDPNSATSQWFVNLADNSANLDAQNGGFSVFGRVIGNGMAVIDEVASLTRVNASVIYPAFDSLPTKDFTGGTLLRSHMVETSSEVVPALSFTAVSSNPALVGASVTGTTLRLSPAANRSGTTTVLITATDLDGATAQTILTVDVLARSAGWHVETGPDSEPVGFTLNPAIQGALPEDSVSVQFGDIKEGANRSRTFTVRNDGSSTFTGLTLSREATNAADFTIISGPGTTTLLPGASTTFTVSFAPGGVGTRNAVLHVRSSDANSASFDLLLSGVGIYVPPPAVTPVSPQALIAGPTGTAVVPDWRNDLVTATDPEGVVSFEQSPAPGTLLPFGAFPLTFTARNTVGKVSTVQTTLKISFEPVNEPEISVTAAQAGSPVPVAGSTDLPEGSVLSAFGTPAISDFRELATSVTIKAGRKTFAGIYWENGIGENKLIAHQNQSAGLPDLPKATFKSFLDPLLSPSGAIAFAAKLSGVKPTEDEGVWTDLFGALGPILREGQVIPGLDGLKLKSVTSLSLMDNAMLALVKLLPAPGRVTANSDTALIRITGPNSGSVLARTGTPFDGAMIKTLSVLQPASLSAGQGRWHGINAVIAKLTLSDKRIVVVRFGMDGTPTKLLQAGADDPALGMKLAKLGLPSVGEPGVATLATKALGSGVTAANDTVLLYAPDGVTFTEAVRENDAANVPDGTVFSGFADPVTNDQGEMLFFGTLRGSGVKASAKNGLWRKSGDAAPELIARAGSPATDKDGNTLTDTAWSAFTSYALSDGENAAPVFLAQLSGKAVRPQKKLGLWAADRENTVRLLLRTGDEIDLPSGSKRLTGIKLLNALPGSFGARRSYNASGSIAVHATFHDKSQAILRIDLP